jgi:hypothetical protein
MKSGTTVYYDLVHAIKEEFPDFEVIPKLNSKLMWACYYFGLMRFWNPYFMERYITTAFGKVYMPAELIGTEIGADVLRHELVHLRDAKRWGILFYSSYLLFPLPAIFTMRAYWEYRGYCESLRCEYERYGVVYSESLNYYVSLFTGPAYLWMCPFQDFIMGQFVAFCKKEGIRIV